MLRPVLLQSLKLKVGQFQIKKTKKMEKYSIPTQPAFYKQELTPTEDWFVGLHWVKAPDYELIIEDHASYTYPVDGWNYYATPPQGS